VQALKGSEQLVGISRVETGAVVAHKITLGSVIPSNAEFDPCVGRLALNFQVLPSRFSSAMRSRRRSPVAVIPSPMTNSM
jgi:hypothetical protein